MSTDRARIDRLATIVFIVVITVGCDQISKTAARAFLSSAHPITFFGGHLKFTLLQNVGAFLSLGARLPESSRFLVFSFGGSALILVGLYYLIFREHLSNRSFIALNFVLGGSIGNQIDRLLFHGSVTDFLFLSWGPVHTGVFNLADMAVVFGAAFFLLGSWRRPSPSFDPDQATAG